MTLELKVFTNLSDEVVNFETKDEFERYYNAHKDEIENMTTRGLNIKFRIDGYKIGRIKGKLTLYPLKSSQQTSEFSQDFTDETGLTLHEKLNNLNMRLKTMEEKLNSFYKSFSNIKNNERDSNDESRTSRTIPQYSQSRFSTFGV